MNASQGYLSGVWIGTIFIQSYRFWICTPEKNRWIVLYGPLEQLPMNGFLRASFDGNLQLKIPLASYLHKFHLQSIYWTTVQHNCHHQSLRRMYSRHPIIRDETSACRNLSMIVSIVYFISDRSSSQIPEGWLIHARTRKVATPKLVGQCFYLWCKYDEGKTASGE